MNDTTRKERRVIGDKPSAFEVFLPGPAALCHRLMEKLFTPDPAWIEQQEQQAAAVMGEQYRLIERHDALRVQHVADPILTGLLMAHQPEPDGAVHVECHGCTPDSGWEEWGHDEPTYHEWPCPVWTLIEQESAR